MNKETVEKLVASKSQSQWSFALHIKTMRGVEWTTIDGDPTSFPIDGSGILKDYYKGDIVMRGDIVIRIKGDLYGCKRKDFMSNYRPVTNWETLKIAIDMEKEINGIKKEVDRLIENIEKITERVKS